MTPVREVVSFAILTTFTLVLLAFDVIVWPAAVAGIVLVAAIETVGYLRRRHLYGPKP